MDNDIQEKITKELLKQIVDKSPNFTEQMKLEIKTIIELGRTPEEITKDILVYLSTR